jgi:hypothetical protein
MDNWKEDVPVESGYNNVNGWMSWDQEDEVV